MRVIFVVSWGSFENPLSIGYHTGCGRLPIISNFHYLLLAGLICLLDLPDFSLLNRNTSKTSKSVVHGVSSTPLVDIKTISVCGSNYLSFYKGGI